MGRAVFGSNVNGSGNVGIGALAGYYETGSNKLFIDNAPRASEADARVKALIYGVFDAAVANQFLTINGNLVTSRDLAFTDTLDSAAVTDEVSLGGYEISAGHRALAISSEETVAADIGLVSTSSLQVRINGATYKIPLTLVP
jgi:hypothetical protein